MEFEVKIKGIRPIIMHNGDGLNPRSAANIEKQAINSKHTRNVTEADKTRVAELDCFTSLWLDGDDKPAIPQSAIRRCLETAAKKLRDGDKVREGLLVMQTLFQYDRERYGESLEDLVKNTQFTTGVVLPGRRSRIERTRAKFDTPWECDFVLDADDELVDKSMLERWLDIAGRRIGLGNWRPEKSGDYGRFETVSLKALE